jgi:hypothetical protein
MDVWEAAAATVASSDRPVAPARKVFLLAPLPVLHLLWLIDSWLLEAGGGRGLGVVEASRV